MSESEDEKKQELEALKGADRLEKAVALHIHSLNTPLMVAEGYLPEEAGQILSEKSLGKLTLSLEKIKQVTLELKAELMLYRTNS